MGLDRNMFCEEGKIGRTATMFYVQWDHCTVS
jgi:hypothetical protein